MYLQEVVITLALLSAQSSLGQIQMFPGEPFHCTRYFDYLMKEYSCRPRGLFEVFIENGDVLTGEELLQEIDSRCSNQSVIETYATCMREIETECPDQFPLVLEALSKKMRVFCDGTKVSSWMLRTLQSGYAYNTACEPVTIPLLGNCSEEVTSTYSQIDSGVSLTTALDILPTTISEYFKCTKAKFSQSSSKFEECGMSWQDMMLTVWLRFLASAGFGIYLADTDEVRLQEQLQMMQFEEAGTMADN